MKDPIARSWLSLQCRMIPGASRAVLGLRAAGGEFASVTAWPEEAAAPALRAALDTDQPQVRPAADSASVVACPLRRDGRVLGVVAIEVERLAAVQQRSVLQIIEWGSAWLELLLQVRADRSAAQLATVLEVGAAAMEARSPEAAAATAANRLARALGCERVAIGLRRRDAVQLVAVSDAAEVDRRGTLAADIEDAMNEAADASDGDADAGDQRDSPGARDRRGRAVLLPGRDGLCGVMLLRVREPLAVDTLALAESVAGFLGPVLEMAEREARGPLARLAGWLPGTGTPRRRRQGLLAAVLLAMALLAFGHGDYRVSAPATVEGAVQRAVVAPVEGYVREARVRSGDVVDAGQVLATLDDERLRLDRRRLESEREELLREHGRAIAELDRPRAAVLAARIGKADAGLALLDEQLARTRVEAPFDAVVVSGDLSRSLGAPVERGEVLFELAPLDGYRLTLAVPESEVAALAPGQRGEVAIAALPGGTLPLQVERIVGLAEADAEGNAFRVEARIEGDVSHLLPGMHGVGKIVIEQRSLFWIWTHELVERIRLWLWTHLP